MQWSEPPLPHDGGPPTIKNHTVTYNDGLLYCFGGYDGSVNHMTLMVYSLKQQCWSKVYGNGRRSSLGSGESVDIITDSDILPNTPSLLSPSSSSSSFHHDYEVTGTPPPGTEYKWLPKFVAAYEFSNH